VKIHPTAWIEEGARLADDVEVGPHAVVFRWAEIGPRTRVHAGAVIGDLPQDLGFKGGESFVRIGADCVIREHVTIHRGTQPATATEVGDGCFLMANSHLAHNVRLGRNVILANGALLAGYVEVGDRAFISGNVVIHQFIRIGRVAMLSGLSGISKDVPPFCVAAGVRRNEVAGLNVVGMRRAGLSPADRLGVKRAFRILYRDGLGFREAAARILAEFPSGPAREIGEFVAASKRGVCPFGAAAEDSGDGAAADAGGAA
jgi:UDP-N-acetylglucosamine acyltransferase